MPGGVGGVRSRPAPIPILLEAQKKVTKEEGLNATPHSFCMLRTPGPAGYWTPTGKIAAAARSYVTGSLRFALGLPTWWRGVARSVQ